MTDEAFPGLRFEIALRGGALRGFSVHVLEPAVVTRYRRLGCWPEPGEFPALGTRTFRRIPIDELTRAARTFLKGLRDSVDDNSRSTIVHGRPWGETMDAIAGQPRRGRGINFYAVVA